MKKLFIHLVLILLFSNPLALFANEKDSIAIKSTLKGVHVYGKRTSFYAEDCKVIVIDSALLKNSSHVSLSELLNENYTANISSYGSEGSVNTIALRGGASRHTQVLWNGIPLNSVSNGGADLSLVPSLIADQVNINFGAPSSLFGSGTFGGAIELNNIPDWNNRFKISLNTQIASFNSQSYALSSGFGSKTIQSSITIYEKSAQGNYTFFNAYKNEISERIHNEYKLYGAAINLSLKPFKHFVINSGVWYQNKDKNIPPIISSYSLGSTNQIDKSLKAYVNAGYLLSGFHVNYSLAFSDDYLLYTDISDMLSSIYTVYSEFDSYRLNNDLSIRYYIQNRFSFDLAGNYTNYKSKVLAYNRDIEESEASVVGAFKYIATNFIFNASVRQQMYSEYFSKTLFSVGVRYKFLQDRMELRTNLANKYRIPSFNDRFWVPGGIPDLNPENGWSADIGLLTKPKIGSFKASAEFNLFYNVINNWIQWMPGELNYWVPVSHKTVHSSGIEFILLSSVPLGQGKIDFDFYYTLKQSIVKASIDESILNHQLPYTPYLTGLNKINYSIHGYSFIYALRYRGYSFANEQNNSSQIIDPFYLHSFQFLKRFKLNKINLNTSVRLTNILNTNFQIIKEYPMPGRAIYFSIGIDL